MAFFIMFQMLAWQREGPRKHKVMQVSVQQCHGQYVAAELLK